MQEVETNEFQREIRLPFINNHEFCFLDKTSDKALLYTLDKLLPDYIYDISKAENNAFTIPEIDTYINEGITVGGHKISDEQMITNISNSWKYVISKSLKKEDIVKLKSFIMVIHGLQSINLIDTLSRFRDMNVSIRGTSIWKCINSTLIDNVFTKEIEIFDKFKNPLEKATNMFLWLCYRQFFEDCNKRTARLVANYILLKNRLGIFTIPAGRWLEFSKLLINFYDTADATEISKYIEEFCLIRFKGNDVIKYIGGMRV